MKYVIVIPIYKNHPNNCEILSLKRCAEVFKSRDIAFVCPKSLEIQLYLDIFQNNKIEFLRFDDYNFNSISSYSRLLLNAEFYEKFLNWDYMLIYQPDAWVFKDELDYWANMNYSYIGAPWFCGENMLELAGNGGFSLRKIKDMISLLEADKFLFFTPFEFAKFHYKKTGLFYFLKFAFKYFKHIFLREKFYQNTPLNEDYAIVKYAKYFDNGFKVAPAKVAAKFSFEVHPELLYELNNKRLPFGCHAYLKHNPNFWAQHIQMR